MRDYWQNLTMRERSLLAGAGALLFLVAVYFVAVRPMQANVSESIRLLDRARVTHNLVVTGAREIKNLKAKGGASNAASDDISVRVTVAREARETGVTISRLQPNRDGGLTVWVESVSTPVFYSWIKTMSDQHGIAPQKVIMQKATGAGRLRVQLEFGGA